MMEEELERNHGPGAPRMFGNAGTEYLRRYGGEERHLAMIGEWVIWSFMRNRIGIGMLKRR